MTDGNTYAINRHLAEREAYDERRELLQEMQDLRDEVDALDAKLKEAEADRDALRRGLHDETVALGCMKARAEAAEAALKTARRDALNEAAQLLEPKNPVDDWTDFARQHHADAIDIRALIEQETKP